MISPPGCGCPPASLPPAGLLRPFGELRDVRLAGVGHPSAFDDDDVTGVEPRLVAHEVDGDPLELIRGRHPAHRAEAADALHDGMILRQIHRLAHGVARAYHVAADA